MKIYDCFMYFDEEVVADVRLHTLNEFVDYFVIVESKFTHKGEPRKLKFDHKKFEKFKDKIIYIIDEKVYPQIQEIQTEDSEDEKSIKLIFNATYRENGQRNLLHTGLKEANDEDLILISDVDEIPKLTGLNFKNINEKIILFKQDMFYYKFNLWLPNLIWTGTKACRKKNLINPQWLRNIKDRKYSFFRIDTLFSSTKFNSIKIINDGGWHFTNLKTPEELYLKLKNFGHHDEFDNTDITITDLKKKIDNGIVLYNHFSDKSSKNKWEYSYKLKIIKDSLLPNYLIQNRANFNEWFK